MMIQEDSIFYQKLCSISNDQTNQMQVNQNQEYSIEMFLNKDVLLDFQKDSKKIQMQQQSLKLQEQQIVVTAEAINETPINIKKKSIFHNFQKHLITLIKKFVTIDYQPAEGNFDVQLAHYLWQAFLKTKSSNKKILHILFGLPNPKRLQQELKQISMQFKEFKNILSKFNVSRITQAQDMLRNILVQQTKALQKSFVQANSNILKFQEFYQYFLSFVNQLQKGPMTKRMTKVRKTVLVQKLMMASPLQ